MIIQKYSTTDLIFNLAQYFDSTVLTDIIAAEITFGTGVNQVRKLWYAYDVHRSSATYNRTQKSLKVSLCNAETANWKYQIPIQIRVKNKANKIDTSIVFYAYIQEALSTEDF